MVVGDGGDGDAGSAQGGGIRTRIYVHRSLCVHPSLAKFVQGAVSHPHLSGSSSRQLRPERQMTGCTLSFKSHTGTFIRERI